MSNRFLGLNSINVLKAYIDKQIVLNENNTRGLKSITVNAYTYVKDGASIPELGIGTFDPVGSNITYPEGWDSLKNTIDNIKDAEGNALPLKQALSEGAIYMSVGTISADNTINASWSTPMQISGQNGVDGTDGKNGAEFKFSYKIDSEEYTDDVLTLENVEGKRVIYYKYKAAGSDTWSEPMIWAKYTTDGINGKKVLHRYCATSIDDVNDDKTLIIPGENRLWHKSIVSTDLSKTYPYLWMKSKEVDAGADIDETNDWSEPVLFSVYGQDGTVPDYNVTLYSVRNDMIKPNAPVMPEDSDLYNDFRLANLEWLDLPETDGGIELISDIESVNIQNPSQLANITDDTILSIANDINISTPIVITSNVIVDLNGKTINANSVWIDESDGSSNAVVFWVKDGGHLTINDSRGGGKVIACDADYSMAVWINGGDAVINGGEFYNGGQNCDLIYLSLPEGDADQKATLEVNGGYFEATDLKGEQAGTGYKRSAINIKNRDIEKCSVVVKGGRFLDFNPTNLDKEVGNVTSFVPEDYIFSTNNNEFIIKVDPLKEAKNIWWQCTVKVAGSTNKVLKIGAVERYTAIDGDSRPGQYTQLLYAWSDTQEQPKLDLEKLDYGWRPQGWVETPERYIADNPEASLWMISNIAYGVNNDGMPNISGIWSTPVKLTGPRGPIGYDYRIEKRYQIGNATKPINTPDKIEWNKLETALRTNDTYPYIWTADYLVKYYMEYEKDEDGNFKKDEITGEFNIVPVKDAYNNDKFKVIKSYGYYRASGIDGIDGIDGNRRNEVLYSSAATAETPETVSIASFASTNYYICNAAAETETIYNLEFDAISFLNGYTGKFVNIGKGDMIIKTINNFKFTNNAEQLTVAPGKSVEIICYPDDTQGNLFIVVE